ncbi:MAG: hypothetical protein GZ088_09650 [Acidipila sp.]|nr:hypothetical protein [Acidipila sp.]
MNDESAPQMVDIVPTDVPQTFIAPPPPQVPITPPNAVTPPPWNGPARQTLKSGEPVTQETYTKQVISRGGGGGIMQGMTEASGVARKDLPAVEYMAQVYIDPQCMNWTVQVDRIGPPKFEGVVMVPGPVEVLSPPLPYPDVMQRVKEIHGGGKYTVRVLNSDGILMRHFPFNIDTMIHPPILTRNNTTVGYRTVEGSQRSVGTSFQNGLTGSPISEEIVKLKEAESLARASKSLKIAEFDAEETMDQLTRRRQLRQEQDEKRAQGNNNNNQQHTEFTTFRSELREIQYAADRRMDQIQQNFEKLLLVINQPKKDDTGVMMLFAKMFESMGNNQVAMLTALGNKGNDKSGAMELAEIMRMTNTANEKVTQMAMSNSASMLENFRLTATKNDKLLESLIISKMEHPENAVKQALELRESGWKQAMEIMKDVEEMRGGGPEEVINPDNGFFSNLGNVILSTLQGFASSGAKGAGKQIMASLANAMQKPQGQQFSQAELVHAAKVMERQELINQGITVPPMQQQLTLPMSRPPQKPQQRRADPRRLFNYVFEIAEEQVAVVPAQTPPMVTEEVEVVQATPESVQTFQPSQQSAEAEVPALQEHVSHALEIMIGDLKRGVAEHDWVDYALSKWDEEFLQRIAQAPDDMGRVVLIRDNSDPALFAQVEEILLGNAKAYEKFLLNLQDLVKEILTPENVNA